MMNFLKYRLLLGAVLILAAPSGAVAGMPGPMPEDLKTVFRLNEEPHQRLEAISFFLLGLVICALAVAGLWNYLQRDFPRLPRLTYPKAFAMVLLWGILFILVLTMISGARELMTPGAWKRKGLTYTLEDFPDESSAMRETP